MFYVPSIGPLKPWTIGPLRARTNVLYLVLVTLIFVDWRKILIIIIIIITIMMVKLLNHRH